MRAAEKKRAQMRNERSAPGRIASYLGWMNKEGGKEGPAASESLAADIAATFSTPEGLRTLIMLEKATLLSSVPDGADDRALRESNAVRNFVLEIRRYVAHGGR